MATMRDKELLKLLVKNGWQVVSVRGSHHRLRKNGKTTIVAVHGQDMPIGELNAILKWCELQVVMSDSIVDERVNVVARIIDIYDLIKLARFREGIEYIFEE